MGIHEKPWKMMEKPWKMMENDGKSTMMMEKKVWKTREDIGVQAIYAERERDIYLSLCVYPMIVGDIFSLYIYIYIMCFFGFTASLFQLCMLVYQFMFDETRG